MVVYVVINETLDNQAEVLGVYELESEAKERIESLKGICRGWKSIQQANLDM